MSATRPAMCGDAWLVPDSTRVPVPVAAAPVICPPGAKIVLMVVLRWENEMMRSGPVLKSLAPLDQLKGPPALRSQTAPTDQALGSLDGEATPWAGSKFA